MKDYQLKINNLLGTYHQTNSQDVKRRKKKNLSGEERSNMVYSMHTQGFGRCYT